VCSPVRQCLSVELENPSVAHREHVEASS
jgi:hypothetical protein